MRGGASRWPDTLAGRLAFALVVFVLLATGAVLAVEYLRGRETLLREARDAIEARDRLAADRLERALGDRLRLVAAWPGLGVAQDIAVDDVDKRLAASLAQLAGSFQDRDLALAVDTVGRVVAASNAAWIGREVQADWMTPMAATEGTGARLYLLRQEGEPGVLAASAVFGPRGHRLGWIALVTPWSELLDEVAPDDRTGLSVRTADGLLVVGADVPREREGPPDAAAAAADRVAPSAGATAHDVPANLLIARASMPELGGLQLQTEITEPVSEALRPLRETVVQLFVLALVFLAVAIPAVVLYARSTTRGLRRLTAAASDVREERAPDFQGVTGAAPREVRVLSDALRTMVARLEASRHELARQESLAAMGMMAAGLAHEIRTPLSIVRGSAEMLGRNVEDGSREAELVSFILDETGRLSRLVNDLLTFARPREPKPAPLDMADVALQTVDAMRREYETRDVTLEADLEPAPIRGDADQLYQVVLNLLANARKASDAGTTVRVTTAVSDGDAVLEVRDHGRGIPAATLEEVWTPFFTTGGGGTGLGLPIVQRIVESHGGVVSLASEEGAGTVATVRIPSRSDA